VSLLIRNAILVTMNDRLEVIEGGISIDQGRITALGPDVGQDSSGFSAIIDAHQGYVLPGFVQTHVHLCQTLFRGLADDLPLLEWLQRRIWPLEAAHQAGTLRASARLAAAELLLTGTTSVLTMETVHDTDAVFEAIAGTGIRASIGKCLMDRASDAPARLQERARIGLDESLALHRRWHGHANGRLRTALAPRFAVSCSRELLEEVGVVARAHGLLVHTHASENADEVALVRELTGQSNICYLADVGLAGPHVCAAHCVWVDTREQALMAERGMKVLHCPGSNMKLGSGVAPIVEMRARGISVSLGADGAACNNRLDMFDEMRLAATLQAVHRHPGALPAQDVVCMATREGAHALGLESEIGSLEVGKRADIILIDRDRPHMTPGTNPYSTIVYTARGTDVRTVLVDGVTLVDDFRLQQLDPVEIATEARAAARQLVARAGL
jgi:5-methylthioadenosine/S-adenosylhomocysteine deaminase